MEPTTTVFFSTLTQPKRNTDNYDKYTLKLKAEILS